MRSCGNPRLDEDYGICAQELFKLKHYNDLDGGILEGFGRLLKFNLKIYVYPTLDTNTGEVITAANLKVGRGVPSRSSSPKIKLKNT